MNIPADVKYVIRQNHQKDYIRAANYINTSNVDACILEHEFGIFGGESGIYILPLINQVRETFNIYFTYYFERTQLCTAHYHTRNCRAISKNNSDEQAGGRFLNQYLRYPCRKDPDH
jgi:hypothetical protein